MDERIVGPGKSPSADEGRMTPSQALLTMVGTVVMFFILIVAIAVIFWQSDRQWGGLPAVNGPGAILYGGVAVIIVVVGGAAIWAWRNWVDCR